MAIDLKKVLQTMKKTHHFVVRIAMEEGDKPNFSKAESILKGKGMINHSQPQSLPIGSCPLEFKRLKDFVGLVYKMDMEFEYPITPSELTNEICSLLNIDRAFVVVRTSENPYEVMEDNYLEYKDDDYVPQLINDIKTDINPNDYYGDEYNKEFVKAVTSKEAKKYQKGFKEVDKKMFNGFE